MTLTEQLKKGKLPIGRYYIKDITGDIFIDLYTNNGCIIGFEDFADNEISEVLAPVPSYEEWQELGNKYDSLQERLYAQAPLHLENQQLKAALGKQSLNDAMIEQLLAHQTIAVILVNMCKLELKKIDTDSAKDLCQKIDHFIEQAIGEKQ